MAKEMRLSDLVSDPSIAGRVIGNRSVPAGTYTFDGDCAVKHEVTTIGDSGRELINISICSKEGKWVDLSALLKRTKAQDGALVYINAWVCQYPTTKELAADLLGKQLVVGGNPVTAYTNWKNGEQTTELFPAGRYLPAELVPLSTAATAPARRASRRSSQ